MIHSDYLFNSDQLEQQNLLLNAPQQYILFIIIIHIPAHENTETHKRLYTDIHTRSNTIIHTHIHTHASVKM